MGEDQTSTCARRHQHDIEAGARFLALLEQRTAEGMIMGRGHEIPGGPAPRTALSRRWRRPQPVVGDAAAEAASMRSGASGFELSARVYGVPEVSVVSMTQHLDMTRAWSPPADCRSVADIDTGFAQCHHDSYAIEQ